MATTVKRQRPEETVALTAGERNSGGNRLGADKRGEGGGGAEFEVHAGE